MRREAQEGRSEVLRGRIMVVEVVVGGMFTRVCLLGGGLCRAVCFLFFLNLGIRFACLFSDGIASLHVDR